MGYPTTRPSTLGVNKVGKGPRHTKAARVGAREEEEGRRWRGEGWRKGEKQRKGVGFIELEKVSAQRRWPLNRRTTEV